MRIVTSLAGNDGGHYAHVLKLNERRIVVAYAECTSTGERASTKGGIHAQTLTADKVIVIDGETFDPEVIEALETELDRLAGKERLPFDDRDEAELDPVERGQAVTVDGSGVVMTAEEVAELTGTPLEEVEALDDEARAELDTEARAILDERDEEVTEDLAEEGIAPTGVPLEAEVPVVEAMALAWVRESAPWYWQRPADALVTELAAMELDGDVVLGLIGAERRVDTPRPTVLAFLGERAWELGLDVPEADEPPAEEVNELDPDAPPVAREVSPEDTAALYDALKAAGWKPGPGPVHAVEELEGFVAGIAAWQVVDIIKGLDRPVAIEWLLELELARKARKRVADSGAARLEVLSR
jgi:hypothetical protein